MSKAGKNTPVTPIDNGDEPQMVQLAPLEVALNACQFRVGKRPDGMTVLSFLHNSGVICFTATLPEQATAELVRQLSGGIEIARAIPMMQ